MSVAIKFKTFDVPSSAAVGVQLKLVKEGLPDAGNAGVKFAVVIYAFNPDTD